MLFPHLFDREILLRESFRVSTQRFAECHVCGNLLQGAFESLFVIRWQQNSAVFGNEFSVATNSVRNDRHAGSHRLKDGIGKAFRGGRQYGHIQEAKIAGISCWSPQEVPPGR